MVLVRSLKKERLTYVFPKVRLVLLFTLPSNPNNPGCVSTGSEFNGGIVIAGLERALEEEEEEELQGSGGAGISLHRVSRRARN